MSFPLESIRIHSEHELEVRLIPDASNPSPVQVARITLTSSSQIGVAI